MARRHGSVRNDTISQFGDRKVVDERRDSLSGGVNTMLGVLIGGGISQWKKKTPEGVGSVENANFAQTSIRSDRKFSPKGSNHFSNLAGRPINTVDDLSSALKNGALRPNQIPVDFVDMNGTRLILNARTSTALQNVGITRSQWVGKNKTGRTAFTGQDGNPVRFDDLAQDQLRRNNLPPSGSNNLPTK